MEQKNESASLAMVVLAFVTVYIVWGSTYFFIQQALSGFPPFILGATRFIIAGLLMMAWCAARGEKLFDLKLIPHAALGGFLMLFIGNGIVIWVEQSLPSALAAIMVSSAPLWFVILDKPKWAVNFKSGWIISALLLGFVGVILLFGERLLHSTAAIKGHQEIIGLVLLSFGVIAWAGGSLYIKYNVKNASPLVNTSWQIMAAGLAFVPGIFLLDETKQRISTGIRYPPGHGGRYGTWCSWALSPPSARMCGCCK
jgi:drug/metabolite transporter (DMT)-like permease